MTKEEERQKVLRILSERPPSSKGNGEVVVGKWTKLRKGRGKCQIPPEVREEMMKGPQPGDEKRVSSD